MVAGDAGSHIMLLGLRSTRETGACTESARHRKEAWQWVAIQRSRDLDLVGTVDNWTWISCTAGSERLWSEPLQVLLIFSFLFVSLGVSDVTFDFSAVLVG